MHPAQKIQQTLYRVAMITCIIMAVVLFFIPFPGMLSLLKFAIIAVFLFAAWMYYRIQKNFVK